MKGKKLRKEDAENLRQSTDDRNKDLDMSLSEYTMEFNVSPSTRKSLEIEDPLSER